jgi:hypothetical protein
MSTAKILVGSPTRITPFILPTRQLSFYSPYLRSLTETATSPPIPIVLRYHCPEVFQILVSWMDSPYNENRLKSKISVKDKHDIPLAFGLWILTKRLGGACLVLGDACIQWLYHEYTDGKCVITPMIAKYVLVYSGAIMMRCGCLCSDVWRAMRRRGVWHASGRECLSGCLIERIYGAYYWLDERSA